MQQHSPPAQPGTPGFAQILKADLLAGFLVFLIALPLCLAISRACGYPPIAGIFTAIMGGLVTPFISNSALTIKGPAAGLIVIAIGCVESFGGGIGESYNVDAYRLALGVGVAAAALQILAGLGRLGTIIGDFFPKAAVHGMLASIGVVIALKQIFIVVGVAPQSKEVLGMVLEIPSALLNLNPEIAVIGLVSLVILFGLPFIKNRYVRMVPAPMLVVLVAVPMGFLFDLDDAHYYRLFGQDYRVGPKFLVDLPSNFFNGMAFPDFNGLLTWNGWKYVMMFFLVGSLESLLSAKAIDLLDPQRRKTNLNRDLTGIGVANLLAALVGGLPMISEIVRSKANLDNGAQTRWANFFHGAFLFVCVAMIPGLLHEIPLAALGAMLVYTGCRLASPREFLHAYQVGREQLVIFVTTLIVSLATDLLIGVLAGAAVEILLHWINGIPLSALFIQPISVDLRPGDKGYVVCVKDSAVFTNWVALKARLARLDPDKDLVLDLSQATVVDHTVMEALHELEKEYEHRGRKLTLLGLDTHHAFSDHPQAARRKTMSGKTIDGVDRSRETLNGQENPLNGQEHPPEPTSTDAESVAAT